MSATLPIGPSIDPHPAKRPERVTLEGRWVTLVPLDAAAHAEALYEGSNGDAAREAVWTYLFNGPFATPPFAADVDVKAKASRSALFRHRRRLRARMAARASCASSLRAVREDGLHTLDKRAPRERDLFLARYVFDELGYRRYEWKCNALNAPSRRAGALRLHLRFSPAHDRQGPQP